MLHATRSRLPAFEPSSQPVQQNIRPEIRFRTFLEKLRQRRRLMIVLTLVGAVAGWLAGLAYIAVRVPAFSASSELLISNTTLQLSGPEAVVTQILVENSLIQSAIEVLSSGRVLDRVIDKVGLEEIERISPQSYLLPWGIFSVPESSDVSRKQAAIRLLRSNMTVKRVSTSQIVSVRARALTAVDAARLTQEIAAAFVQELYDANAVVTTSAALRERIKVLGPTARIITEPIPPKFRDSPPAPIVMLLSIMLGGTLGAGCGLAFTASDRRLRTTEQLAVITAVECFGYVPLIDPQSSSLSASDSNSDLESILRGSVLRRVRSAVLERTTKVPHIVGVTSCQATEGRTTLATNLARFIARDGSPVLLIDASCPEVANGLTRGKTAGLLELLRGTVAPDEVILGNICLNLDFLPSGKGLCDLDMLWGNLVDLINSGRNRRYQWIILDLPALSKAIDVRSAGQIVDDLLIAVEWGRTSEAQLEQALRDLGPLRDRVLGTVINKIPLGSLRPETPRLTLLARSVISMASDPQSRKAKVSPDDENVS
jgi:succinoglycan biosynthesis transport protein ExoP